MRLDRQDVIYKYTMIAFDLCCENDHTFEVWFKDRKAFDEQNEQDLVLCPVCESTNVRKILSAVSVRTKSPAGDHGNCTEVALRQMWKKIYAAVEKNTEDVGTAFAEEALKMHYGATEPRNIRGVATAEEEKTLRKENVSFMKIPVSAKTGPKGH